MISLQERLRMMRQMQLLQPTLQGRLEQQVIRKQMIFVLNSCCQINYCFKTESAIECLKFVKGEKIWLK